MPGHLTDKEPIRPTPIPDKETQLAKIRQPYFAGLDDGSMGQYMFDQVATGNWSQDDLDTALDSHTEAMKLITTGAGAAAVGAAADLTAFGTTVLYNGYNMARGGEWTWPEDMRDVPLTQEWWGAQLGLSKEQTSSLAFIGAGIAIAPTKLDAADAKFVSAALKTAKALGGSRGAAVQRSAAAARMLDEGMDETEVWRKTGWWRDPADGKMKFAMSDADAVLDHEMIAQQALNKIPADYDNKHGALIELRADQVLKHDALYELYPQLAGYPVTVRVKQNADGVWELANKDYRGGSYNRETNMIVADSRDPRRTLVHEMQHAIQDYEGMAGGGAIDLFTKSARGFRLADFMHQMYKKPDALLDFDGPEDIAAYIKTLDPDLPDEQALSFANKLDRVAMGDMSEAQMNQDIWDWGMQVEVDGKKFMRWMEQVKLFPEEAGMDIKTLMTELDDDTLQAYALVRYLSESGEIEARITESLMHLSQEQLDKLVMSPRLLRPYLNRANVEKANKQGLPLQTMRSNALEPVVSEENAKLLKQITEDLSEDDQLAFIQALVDKDPTLVARLMEMLDDAPVRNAE